MSKIKFENLLDEAIVKIRNGENISSVLSTCPTEFQTELKAALEIVKNASALPKKTVPQPAMRRLFLEHQVEKVSNFMRFMQSLKTSYAIAIATFILAFAGTTIAAVHSLPGDKFFALKKAYENTRLFFAFNAESKAQLELTFADNRLNEAQIIFSENSDNATKTQAINELQNQTASALNNVKQLASSNNLSKNSDIIKQAETIAQGQANLVAQADPNAKQSTVQNQQTLAAIKSLVAAANEQNSTSLPQTTQFDLTGTVNNVDKTTIVVDNAKYTFDPSIAVLNNFAINISISQIGVGDKVHIQGNLIGSQNIISTLVLEQKAQIKTNFNGSTQSANTQSSVPTNNAPANPNDTFGGFIVEPATSK